MYRLGGLSGFMPALGRPITGIICGIDDNWRFSFTILISKPRYTDWTITLPRKETIDGFSLERETLFNRITKVHLSFPGKGGIVGDLPAAPNGYHFVLAPDRTSLELLKQ